MFKKMQIININSKIGDVKAEIRVASDKSISHRSLIFAALAVGRAKISNLLESEDVMATKKALEALGVVIIKEGDEYIVEGKGLNSFVQPKSDLYCGNSGTSARLLMGFVSTLDVAVKFTGDASLSKRPMLRVLEPLKNFGIEYEDTEGHMPILLRGNAEAIGFNYMMQVPSAQVKSALILAALNATGETNILETELSRDHTEIMLKNMGFAITENITEAGKEIKVSALQPEVKAQDFLVPADPSSAAFFIALALLADNSEILLKEVCVNKLRAGFIEAVKLMGADISYENRREVMGEKIADIRVLSSQLKAVDLPASFAPSMIDEYPILAILCALANGKSRLNGLAELRVKESDRLFAIYNNLKAIGVNVTMGDDYLEITGQQDIEGVFSLESFMDHRIAMSFIILAQIVSAEIEIKGVEIIDTSFPEFFDILTNLGGKIIWQK